MKRSTVFFLLVVSPILAILLIFLGYLTLYENPLGWFLILVGASYVIGMIVVIFIQKRQFWDAPLNSPVTHEEQGDRSFWLITLGMMASFFFSPLETLVFTSILPRDDWMKYIGFGFVLLGTGLFLWARRTLKKNYSGHLSTRSEQVLVQGGPYRLLRHPAYSGYLFMALGLSLGYSSLAGLLSVFAILLPGMVYRIKTEEKLLIEHFGDSYRLYMCTTKRLIPGIW